jgi:hypothetical protein
MKIKKHVIATESQVLQNQLRPGNGYTALADKDGFLNPALFAWGLHGFRAVAGVLVTAFGRGAPRR